MIIFRFILLVLFGAALFSNDYVLLAERKSGIVSRFKKATFHYKKGNFSDAAEIYTRILKSYPDHEPSKIQLAKSLYRLERVYDAYKVFRYIDLTHLDPESSYEYGQSFYHNKKYSGALKAFRKIPNGHPLFDLAGYYGAICALKLKRYQEAQDLLENSVVLPNKLLKSRNLYKKHIREVLLAQQQLELKRQKKKAIRRLKKEPAETEAPPVKTVKVAKTKKASKRARKNSEYKGFFLDDRNEVGVFFDSLSQDKDFHSGESKKTGFSSSGLKIEIDRLGQFSSNSGASWAASVFFQAAERSGKGLDEQFEHSPRTKVIRQVLDGFGTAGIGLGEFAVTLGSEAKMMSDIWAGIKYQHLEILPKFGTLKGGALDQIEVYAGRNDSRRQMQLAASVNRVLINGEFVYLQYSESILASTKFGGSFLGELSADFNQYDYQEVFYPGPEWDVQVGFDLASDFLGKGRIGLDNTYETESNFTLYKTKSAPSIAFDVESFISRFYLEMALFEWMEFRIEAGRWVVNTTKVKPLSKEVTEEIAASRFKLINHLVATIAFNVKF